MSQNQGEKVLCPSCEAELEYVPVNTTHIWSCTECPIVMFEYINNKNVSDLQQLLKVDYASNTSK